MEAVQVDQSKTNDQQQIRQFPVVMYPVPGSQQQRVTKGPAVYNQLPAVAVRVFSVFNIVLCSISVGLQASSITYSANYWWGSLDYTGHGFWCGCLYMVAGILGYSTTYKKTKAMVITTLVASIIALLGGVTSALLAGLSNCDYNIYNNGSYRYVSWCGIKWSLMSFAIIAAINNIVLLVILSVTLCKKPTAHSTRYQPPMQTYYQNMGFTPVVPTAASVPVMMPNVYSPAAPMIMQQSDGTGPVILNPQQ